MASATAAWSDLYAIRLDESADGLHRSWVMLLPQGTYPHPKGTLNLSESMLTQIKRNFDDGVRGIEIALDYDHKASEGDSRAPGWIERVQYYPQGSAPVTGIGDTPAGLWGLIRWTRIGLSDVKDQIYRYISAEYKPEWLNPVDKQTYKNVLVGATLTNRPFMNHMPAIALSEFSTTPWGNVDKSKLPDSAFLDPKNRRLPIYEGAGEIGADGRYSSRGKINLHGARAALAAIHGARSGKLMTGLPAGIVERLQSILGDSSDSKESEEMATRKAAEQEQESFFFMGAPGTTKGSLTKGMLYGDGSESAVSQKNKKSAPEENDEMELDDGMGDGSGDEDMEYAEDDAEDAADGGADEDQEDQEAAPPANRGARKKGARKMSEWNDDEEVTLDEMRAEILRLRERDAQREAEHKEMAFTLYERDVESQVVSLTEKLGTHATSKAFATEFKRFMLNEGYSLTSDERAAVLKLCDLALKRGAVDMRSLGSSYDQETKRTVKLSSAQAKSQKQHTPEDELEVMDVAERIALSEGKIAHGEDLTSLKLSDREALIARAAKMTGWGAAN